MKKILIMLAVAFAVNFAQAQDARAKEILDKVSAKTKTFTYIYADFVFSTENAELDIDESNAGVIKINGGKYNLKMKGLKGSDQENDYILEVFCNESLLWNYMKDGNQVTISDLEEEGNELMDPSSIFTIYERGFKSEYVGEDKVNGKAVYQINLFPDSDEYEVEKIEVFVDKANYVISAATLYGTDGNQYRIVVNKFDTSRTFPDSDFEFNESNYEDVEVIDFR